MPIVTSSTEFDNIDPDRYRVGDVGVANGALISGTITFTVTLGSGIYLSPLTITSQGTILPAGPNAIGVYVPPAAVDSTVVNRGHITGGGPTYRIFGGGNGIDFASSSNLFNFGTIVGGSGQFYPYGGVSGAAAVSLESGGLVINDGVIVGGAGGSTTGGYNGNYGTGGAGGVGLDLGSAGRAVNNGTIMGGPGSVCFYSVQGGGAGVALSLAATLVNRGTIVGGVAGISMDSYRSVGGSGVLLANGGWLANDGSIDGGQSSLGFGNAGGIGIELRSGGTVINHGAVTGGVGGNDDFADGGTGGAGVVLTSGGTLTNVGTITGGDGGMGADGGNGGLGGTGIYLNGGLVIESGTVSGGAGGVGALSGNAGNAVTFGTAGATLIIDPGAVFNGQVIANAAVADVLELAGTKTGTLTGLGTSFTNFATVVVDASAKWSLAGSNSLASGASVSLGSAAFLTVRGALLAGPVLTLAGSGTLTPGKGGVIEVGTAGGAATGYITVDPGATLIGTGRLASLVNDGGTVEAHGGTLSLAGAVAGQGTVAIDSGATLIAGAALKATTISFLAGSSESLLLRHPTSVTGTISGFDVAGARDRIDLVNFAATGSAFSGHTLTVTGGGGVATLRFAGNYTLGNFVLSSDHTGGTNIRFG